MNIVQIGDGNLLAQAAHLAHVLLAAHGVDHAARREEEQALEERVRHQVENARGDTRPRRRPGTCSRAGRRSSRRELS